MNQLPQGAGVFIAPCGMTEILLVESREEFPVFEVQMMINCIAITHNENATQIEVSIEKEAALLNKRDDHSLWYRHGLFQL